MSSFFANAGVMFVGIIIGMLLTRSVCQHVVPILLMGAAAVVCFVFAWRKTAKDKLETRLRGLTEPAQHLLDVLPLPSEEYPSGREFMAIKDRVDAFDRQLHILKVPHRSLLARDDGWHFFLTEFLKATQSGSIKDAREIGLWWAGRDTKQFKEPLTFKLRRWWFQRVSAVDERSEDSWFWRALFWVLRHFYFAP